MGCTNSSSSYLNEPKIDIWKPHFVRIGLSNSDISRFYKFYVKLLNKKHVDEPYLPTNDILIHIDVDPNKFIVKLMSIFKPSREITGSIEDFLEFTLGLWNFGTLEDASLAKFGFILYHEVKAGMKVLSQERLAQMTKDVFSYEYKNSAVAIKILEKIAQLTLPLNSDEFDTFSRKNPQLLYAITQIQRNRLRRKVFGATVWRRYRSYRKKLGEAQLMKHFLHANPALLTAGTINRRRTSDVVQLNIESGQGGRISPGVAPSGNRRRSSLALNISGDASPPAAGVGVVGARHKQIFEQGTDVLSRPLSAAGAVRHRNKSMINTRVSPMKTDSRVVSGNGAAAGGGGVLSDVMSIVREANAQQTRAYQRLSSTEPGNPSRKRSVARDSFPDNMNTYIDDVNIVNTDEVNKVRPKSGVGRNRGQVSPSDAAPGRKKSIITSEFDNANVEEGTRKKRGSLMSPHQPVMETSANPVRKKSKALSGFGETDDMNTDESNKANRGKRASKITEDYAPTESGKHKRKSKKSTNRRQSKAPAVEEFTSIDRENEPVKTRKRKEVK